MSKLTIAYNGSAIFDEMLAGESAVEVTLLTDGMYMEDDVTVALTGRRTDVSSVLNDNEWSVISEVAQAGEGGSYWAVGDTKAVALSGTVGTLSLNTTLWVYIVGINHRDVTGITFQGFKTAQSGGVSVALVNNYNATNSMGSLAYFNMNHWGDSSSSPYNTNYGGWKGCDARYDLLGSTNVPPSGYGATPTTSRVGYDAGTTTATNPVSNTLMSCLPSDLRAVMQPMTIYTDNKDNSSNVAANVTTSVDYLPLLAEYEILGYTGFANQYEKDNQTQYAYYSAGNSKIKYRHSSTDSIAAWWARSPGANNGSMFCFVRNDGTASIYYSMYSYGLAPAFMV